jgi:hypothetical protein
VGRLARLHELLDQLDDPPVDLYPNAWLVDRGAGRECGQAELVLRRRAVAGRIESLLRDELTISRVGHVVIRLALGMLHELQSERSLEANVQRRSSEVEP